MVKSFLEKLRETGSRTFSLSLLGYFRLSYDVIIIMGPYGIAHFMKYTKLMTSSVPKIKDFF